MNNKTVLHKVITFLEENGITTWIFGGWAEELLGMIKPRNHKDIDLLYPAEDFTLLDSLLSKDDQIQEIKEKHLPHKRAFLFKDVLIELLLVQNKNGKHYTNFWGKTIYYWPANTFDQKTDYKIANKSALLDYRKNHEKLQNTPGFPPPWE